ncbi:hypothetical protein ACFV1W_34640 [Kitasatospora sp. NPDC059648]|uniref:hypothetical protein n=1 Tax=Kitasatospora sp. NPDC059648 TaxID=3346894 RepID=UPI0036875257
MGASPAHRAAPRRARAGLAAQFVLQFLYIPLGIALVFAFLFMMVAGGGPGGGDAGDFVGAVGGIATASISWRRLRVEWHGRPEDWEQYTEGLLRKRFASAEKNSGWEPSRLPPGGVRLAVSYLWRPNYRGLAPIRVEQLARRHGWSVDWGRSSSAKGELCFYRLVPPPAQAGVPDPAGPQPAPGAPWGPLRCRVLLPLFTLVFWPRVRILELLRSPRLYERHLRRHLAKLFRTELARERTRDNYRYDSVGRILRRVAVKPRHYRGAGAWAVLRIAAEHGWTLDHSFPADPSGTLHLCRLEERTRRSR